MTTQETARTVGEVRELWDDIAPVWKWNHLVDAVLGVTLARRRHMSGITGDVLDVACGTGENFKYLREADSITALDLSPAMVRRARVRAGRLGLNGRVEVADAAMLPYNDDSFDVVVSAMSSCTFPDHVSAFLEMKRVARPGGRILLLEHGRSSIDWIARRQDAGVHKRLESGNCRNNRDPRAEIEEAGLDITSHVRSHLGIVHRFEIAVS